MSTQSTQKKNSFFILGILLLQVGMNVAQYGYTVPLASEVGKMNALPYYILVAAQGTLGMMLILPIVGRLTAIFGQRNLITAGVVVQLLGRIGMMLSPNWVILMLCNLLQSIGGGLYTTAAYVLMTMACEPKDRVKYFGYIAVANAVGAIVGPMLASTLYAVGGVVGMLAYVCNLPLTVVGYIMIYKHCVNVRNPEAAKGFDYLGVILSVVGLACLVFWLNLAGKMIPWISVPSIALVLATVVSMAILIRRELTIAAPAIPLKMFKNKRLTSAFICSMAFSAYATCTTTYIVMWVSMNYATLPGGTFFSGTYNMAQQLVILILGFFLGGYIGRKFTKRFRPFAVAAMIVALAATLILCCLKFTGTAAGGDIVMVGAVPVGMLVIYLGSGLGGFTSVVVASTLPAFWQSNTAPAEIPAGQALYSFGAMLGSTLCNALAAAVLAGGTDYIRAFLVGTGFTLVGTVVALIFFRFGKEETAAN